MDLDAYVAAHYAQWPRLEQLVRRSRLTGAEADELLDLYQRASTHLSVVRSASPTRRSSPTCPRCWRAPGSPPRGGIPRRGPRSAGSSPAPSRRALYRLRWWWGPTALLNVLAAVARRCVDVAHPQVDTSVLTPEEINAYVGTDFQHYYSEYAHHEFASMVWVNNAWVSAHVIALGVLGLPVLYILFQNIANLGVVGGADDLARPHRAVLRAHPPARAARADGRLHRRARWGCGCSGRGSSPGRGPALQSFAAEGRSAVGVALGLVAVLLVSGVIEGFVTPVALPTVVRVGIGVVVESAFLAYVFVLGRRAYAAGATGDVDVRDVGDTVPVAG